jgi:hypothetical protein
MSRFKVYCIKEMDMKYRKATLKLVVNLVDGGGRLLSVVVSLVRPLFMGWEGMFF